MHLSIRTPALIAACGTLPQAAVAHPGHGVGSGLWHYLASPVHLAGIAALALAVFIAGTMIARRRRGTSSTG